MARSTLGRQGKTERFNAHFDHRNIEVSQVLVSSVGMTSNAVDMMKQRLWIRFSTKTRTAWDNIEVR
jgi:hypothetical protein